MNRSVAQLTHSDTVLRAQRDIDSGCLAQYFGISLDAVKLQADSARMRVAATLAIGQVFSTVTADEYMRQAPETTASKYGECFRKWSAYFDATKSVDALPAEDLLFFAAAGLLAERPTEVRSMLRNWRSRAAQLENFDAGIGIDWARRVRSTITVAVLLLVSQSDHKDIAMSGELVEALAAEQRTLETAWLEHQSDSTRSGLLLLALYHVAQSVIRTSEFLLSGAVSTNGTLKEDFAPELARLLSRAEEYISISTYSEIQLWLRAVAAILWRLRTDSIWVSGRGISERLDRLVSELAQQRREQPIFSLLPSQHEALRKNLLDPARVAVVLQMPTSAGKTLLAEFTIVQTFEAYKEGTKIVYVVPTRALATQIRRTLAEDLRPLGINVSAAGSAFEEDPYELQLLEHATGVVVSTPEKLDLLLRTRPAWFEGLRLVVVDEAHLLRDSERGVRLELLLANLRREQPKARLLLMTPFIENAKEVAAWLGGERASAIDVHWRPSRVLLGMTSIDGTRGNKSFSIEWREPHDPTRTPQPFVLPGTVRADEVSSAVDRVVFLTKRLRNIGTVLAMFAGSRSLAEKTALTVANERQPLEQPGPTLRVAIEIARDEYGGNSALAHCLQRGVAFHHSAISSLLRYLIEDQIRARVINFVAATSTLAQGMNFPVGAVVVHSVNKPNQGGPFTPSEFWNIAGRAGRVGMSERGFVVFANDADRAHWAKYSESLTEHLRSALLHALNTAHADVPLKKLYRDYPELRPFLQFLAHAAATTSPDQASANLDELIESSLASRQIEGADHVRTLRLVARQYLSVLTQKGKGYLKASDATGLGSFSFDELYARIGSSTVLKRGPTEILRDRENGIFQLIDALRWLPELSLAIGMGSGQMSVQSAAEVVTGWMDGKSVHQLADKFPGNDEPSKVRNAGTYIFGKVSQTVSWGAHAYIRGWLMRETQGESELSGPGAMLPAYIQYGVRSPEAALASLLNVPRQFAEAFASEYRESHGSLQPEQAPIFRDFVESADRATWRRVVSRTGFVNSIDPDDVRRVWRDMQGLPF